MCYEERYYSEWTRRSARQRETPKPAVEPSRPEPVREQDRQPARAPAEQTETASVE